MRAAVYNRWLHQRGGGERHAAMAAAVLAERFQTELVTHRAISREALQAALNIDLSAVNIRVIPALPPNRFSSFTRAYDLFVNSSFMTSQPSAARRGMLLVLFPSPVDRGWAARLRQAVGRLLIREFLLPEWTDGFYDVQELGRGWFRYTTDRATVSLRVPPGRRSVPVDIVAGNFRPEGDLRVRCRVGEHPVGERDFPPTPGNFVTWRLELDRKWISNRSVELTLESPTFNPSEGIGRADDNREVGLAVTDVRIPHPRRYLHELLFRRVFRELGLRLEGLPTHYSLEHLGTYDLICPISEFSRNWMREYWSKDGPLLYPPVDTSGAESRPKQRIILGVGRFFRGSHEKKHGEMIKQFVQMVREGLRGWTLHLAGHQSGRDIDLDYTAELRRRAHGHPIEIHVDMDFERLRRLYADASIYWHAAGFGERVTRNPVRFEHFGITVVEAMASAAVPIVLDQGGLPELVTNGVDGFHWSTPRQLRARTWELVRDPARREHMAAAARASSEKFNVPAFRARLNELVDSLGFA